MIVKYIKLYHRYINFFNEYLLLLFISFLKKNFNIFMNFNTFLSY